MGERLGPGWAVASGGAAAQGKPSPGPLWGKAWGYMLLKNWKEA